MILKLDNSCRFPLRMIPTIAPSPIVTKMGKPKQSNTRNMTTAIMQATNGDIII
jgi:hypothetical protein